MASLYLAFAIDTLLIAFTFYWIRRKSYKTDEKVLASANEAPVTVILSLFCLGLSYFLIFSKGTDATVAGTDAQSYWFIGAFSVVSTLLGCYSLLYTYVIKCVILPDRLTAVDPFGISRDFYWNEIDSVSIPALTRNIRIKSGKGSCTVRSGNIKQYKNFIGILKDFIPRNSGADVVSDLYHRL